MQLIDRSTPTAARPPGARDGYRTILVASFAVLLVIAVVARVLHLDWRALLPGAEGNRSMVDGVRSAVYTFMSYLP